MGLAGPSFTKTGQGAGYSQGCSLSTMLEINNCHLKVKSYISPYVRSNLLLIIDRILFCKRTKWVEIWGELGAQLTLAVTHMSFLESYLATPWEKGIALTERQQRVVVKSPNSGDKAHELASQLCHLQSVSLDKLPNPTCLISSSVKWYLLINLTSWNCLVIKAESI